MEVLFGSAEGKGGGLECGREGLICSLPFPPRRRTPPFSRESSGERRLPREQGPGDQSLLGKLSGVCVGSSPCPLRASLSPNALALRRTHRPGVSHVRWDEVSPGSSKRNLRICSKAVAFGRQCGILEQNPRAENAKLFFFCFSVLCSNYLFVRIGCLACNAP